MSRAWACACAAAKRKERPAAAENKRDARARLKDESMTTFSLEKRCGRARLRASADGATWSPADGRRGAASDDRCIDALSRDRSIKITPAHRADTSLDEFAASRSHHARPHVAAHHAGPHLTAHHAGSGLTATRDIELAHPTHLHVVRSIPVMNCGLRDLGGGFGCTARESCNSGQRQEPHYAFAPGKHRELRNLN
jgi:hypothetical protein